MPDQSSKDSGVSNPEHILTDQGQPEQRLSDEDKDKHLTTSPLFNFLRATINATA